MDSLFMMYLLDKVPMIYKVIKLIGLIIGTLAGIMWLGYVRSEKKEDDIKRICICLTLVFIAILCIMIVLPSEEFIKNIIRSL